MCMFNNSGCTSLSQPDVAQSGPELDQFRENAQYVLTSLFFERCDACRLRLPLKKRQNMRCLRTDAPHASMHPVSWLPVHIPSGWTTMQRLTNSTWSLRTFPVSFRTSSAFVRGANPCGVCVNPSTDCRSSPIDASLCAAPRNCSCRRRCRTHIMSTRILAYNGQSRRLYRLCYRLRTVCREVVRMRVQRAVAWCDKIYNRCPLKSWRNDAFERWRRDVASAANNKRSVVM